jgi:hypothetical protein
MGQSVTFYTTPVSNFAAKVEIALRLKGMAFEAVPPPGGYGSAAYKAIVPAGTIPAIVHDGLVLAESETIVEYLDEAFPEPPLLPEWEPPPGPAAASSPASTIPGSSHRSAPSSRTWRRPGATPAFVAQQLGLFPHGSLISLPWRRRHPGSPVRR